MDQKNEAEGINHEQDTLYGREVTVSFQDPKKDAEIVTVRKVALRNLGRYATVVGNDEAAEIGFYTGKPEQWAESLSEESLSEVLETGRALSSKRFTNFAERATKFDRTLREQSPVLGQLAESAKAAHLASRLGVASNT